MLPLGGAYSFPVLPHTQTEEVTWEEVQKSYGGTHSGPYGRRACGLVYVNWRRKVFEINGKQHACHGYFLLGEVQRYPTTANIFAEQ